MAKSNIIVLIPSYNELVSLKKFLPLLNKHYKFLVVNDCSTDKTLKYLKEKKYPFVSSNKNNGYEKTLIFGIKHVLKKFRYIKYIITFDGDNQLFVSDLKNFKNIIKIKKPILIVGERKKFSRLMESIISKLFFKKFKIKDPLCAFKAYQAKILRKHLNQLKSDGYLIELTKFLVQKYKNVINTKINTRERVGKPRVGGFFGVNFKLIKILLYIKFFN